MVEKQTMQELSARQAAEIIGLSHTMIYRYVKDGLLPARKVGRIRAVKIDAEELRRFAETHHYDFNEKLVTQYTN